MANNAFHIAHATINGLTLSGVTGYGLSSSWNNGSAASDGTVHESLHFVTNASPAFSCSTVDLAGALSVCPMNATGLPIAVITALKLYGRRTSGGGTFDAANARWVQASNGLMGLSGISWSQGGVASVSLDGVLTSTDGDTAPWSETAGASPDAAQNVNAYALRSLSVGGTQLVGVTDFNLSIGNGISAVGNEGKPYPVLALAAGATGQAAIRASFTVRDLSMLAAITTPATVVAVFSQMTQGGMLSASAAKTITLHNCMMLDDSPLTGSQGSISSRRFTVYPRISGSTLPLDIA